MNFSLAGEITKSIPQLLDAQSMKYLTHTDIVEFFRNFRVAEIVYNLIKSISLLQMDNVEKKK